MANTVNLQAETGANMIGDDSVATLTLENQSSGQSLKIQSAGGTGVGLSIVSTATTGLHVASAQSGAIIQGGNTYVPLTLQHASLGAVTVAPLKIVASGVSAAVLEITGNAFISTTSGGQVTAALRVKHGDSYYYLPLMAAVDGAAAI